MEIIDKSPSVTPNTKKSITFLKGALLFSAASVQEIGLQVGDKISFAMEPDRVYFFKSLEKGFSLCRADHGLSTERLRLRLYNSSLVALFNTKYPQIKLNGSKFLIRKSATIINDQQSFEILIHKKIKK